MTQITSSLAILNPPVTKYYLILLAVPVDLSKFVNRYCPLWPRSFKIRNRLAASWRDFRCTVSDVLPRILLLVEVKPLQPCALLGEGKVIWHTFDISGCH